MCVLLVVLQKDCVHIQIHLQMKMSLLPLLEPYSYQAPVMNVNVFSSLIMRTLAGKEMYKYSFLPGKDLFRWQIRAIFPFL